MSEGKLGAKGEGFFGIDRRSWAEACDCGLNSAAAYLVQARGTGGDQKTTSWSALAISQYAGISRTKAKAAIDKLQSAGLVKLLVDGKHPRYQVLPACEVPGTSAYPREPLDCLEQLAFDAIVAGGYISGKDRGLRGAITKGWLDRSGDSVAPEPDIKPDLIWLPNTLVTGARDEVPPLALVRECQDVMTLRLLVGLYGAHLLREDGGVKPTVIRQQHKRFEVGRKAQYIIWGFEPSDVATAYPSSDVVGCHFRKLTTEESAAGKSGYVDFFSRLQQLDDLGLIEEWIPTLYESDDLQAEVIHPLGTGNTESMEDQLGRAARLAALELLTVAQRAWATDKGLILVPVPRHISKVSLVSVARL